MKEILVLFREKVPKKADRARAAAKIGQLAVDVGYSKEVAGTWAHHELKHALTIGNNDPNLVMQFAKLEGKDRYGASNLIFTELKPTVLIRAATAPGLNNMGSDDWREVGIGIRNILSSLIKKKKVTYL
jgi:hypothetical protein